MKERTMSRVSVRSIAAGTAMIVATSGFAADSVQARPSDLAETMNSGRSSTLCRGEEPTHINEDGTSGNDVILVTEPISVSGWNGDDLICVKVAGREYGANVDGGNGRDTIITFSGENFIYGGADGDSILSNSADHVLDGEDGNDNIFMGQHADGYVYGGDGNDRIFGTPFGDAIHAGSGNDFVIGFDGNDAIEGGTGNDQLTGSAGTDTLDGQAGDDVCTDVVAPQTTFVNCETVNGLMNPQGPDEIALG